MVSFYVTGPTELARFLGDKSQQGSLTGCYERKRKCDQCAAICVEGRDSIGHPIWHRDFCEGHADPIIAKAKSLGIRIFSH